MASFIFYTSSKCGRSLCPTLYYKNCTIIWAITNYCYFPTCGPRTSLQKPVKLLARKLLEARNIKPSAKMPYPLAQAYFLYSF